MTESAHPAAVRDGAARAVGAAGLISIGAVHLLDITGKFSETPYMAWMYVGLIITALVLAGELIRSGAPWAWAGGAALSASALVGYTLTRTVGLPQAQDDIGSWTEQLGLLSLYVEGAFIALSALTLIAARRVRMTAGQRGAARATSTT